MSLIQPEQDANRDQDQEHPERRRRHMSAAAFGILGSLKNIHIGRRG